MAVPAALAGAAALGALWAALATAIHLGRRVHEVLVTLLLNFVAVLLVQQALAGPLGQFGAGLLQSPAVPAAEIALEAYGTRRTCRVPDRARRRRRPVPRALAHAVRVFASRGGSFAPRGGLCRVLDAEAGSLSMQRQIGVPSALVAVIEGLTMLFVLAATVRRA